jgi:hypothetical protein
MIASAFHRVKYNIELTRQILADVGMCAVTGKPR